MHCGHLSSMKINRLVHFQQSVFVTKIEVDDEVFEVRDGKFPVDILSQFFDLCLLGEHQYFNALWTA